MSAAFRRSFSSLQIPNYRRYFAGQLVSLSGNWMQIFAEMWLMLQLTNSGVAVGATAALQFVGMLGLGAWGGLLADRLPKRRLLLVTQTLLMLPSLAFFALTVSDVVTPAMLLALVFARGAVNAIDNPTRQSFVMEMVGAERVVNAVSLNSVLIHSARIVGPAGAGVVIATLGVGPCFLLNAASFAAMIVALRGMDAAELRPSAPAAREAGAIRAGLRYVAATPELLIPLAMMALVGTLGFNFQVILPLLARFTFDAGAGTYTVLAMAMATGSVAGAIAAGARGMVSPRLMVGAAFGFGASAALAAAAPSLALTAAALVPLGAASVTFAAGINSWLQLKAEPFMRGRVMALYSIVFLGSTPIGAPIAGWLSQAVDPRAALLMTAAAAVLAGIGARFAFARVASDGGWRRRRMPRRGAVAAEAGGANEPDRLERRGGLDIEPNPVALLDGGNGRVTAAPGQGHEDRVARADGRDLRPDPCDARRDDREQADRPQPQERDPARALRRQAGRRPGAGERRAHGLRRPRRAAEVEADSRGDDPPGAGDDQGGGVGVLVRDDHADRAERRRDAGDEQHRDPQQVAEGHRVVPTKAP